jgi:ribonuclease P protein component
MKTNRSLGKSEKLKSRKQIDQLFKARKFITDTPIRLFYELHRTEVAHGDESANNIKVPLQHVASVQVGFGCSKKFFKQAVRRNRVKRLLREAYRLQKGPLWTLCQANGCKLTLFWLYGHNQLPSQELINQKVGNLIQELNEKLSGKLNA